MGRQAFTTLPRLSLSLPKGTRHLSFSLPSSINSSSGHLLSPLDAHTTSPSIPLPSLPLTYSFSPNGKRSSINSSSGHLLSPLDHTHCIHCTHYISLHPSPLPSPSHTLSLPMGRGPLLTLPLVTYCLLYTHTHCIHTAHTTSPSIPLPSPPLTYSFSPNGKRPSGVEILPAVENWFLVIKVVGMSLDQCFNNLPVHSPWAFVWDNGHIIVVECTGGDLDLQGGQGQASNWICLIGIHPTQFCKLSLQTASYWI